MSLLKRGRYANFIKDAKTKYEIRNGRNIGYIYENVIYDEVSSKREVIESKDDVAMASYIVTFVKDAVVAADAINSVRLKGEDIPLALEVGDIELGGGLAGGAIEVKGKLGKIAVKTDIGKISNLVGDTVIGFAAGGEDALNKLLKDNKKAKADKLCRLR